MNYLNKKPSAIIVTEGCKLFRIFTILFNSLFADIVG